MTNTVIRRVLRAFSLVELMIAMSLGLLVLTALFAAYQQGRVIYERGERLARLNERALYAMSVLEPDVQLAGYYGYAAQPSQLRYAVNDGESLRHHQLRATSPPARGLPPGAQSCGNNFALDVAQVVQVSNARYALACPAGSGGPVPGADTLTIRRASTGAADLATGRIHLLTSRLIPDNQLLFMGTSLPAGSSLHAGRVELRDLLVRSYYVARRSDGAGNLAPALRVKTLTSIAGTPAFVDTEVLSGVEDLQIEVGYVPAGATGANTPLRYVSADALPAQARIAAVRLWLRVRAEDPDPGYTDLRRYDYSDVTYTPNDHLHRLLISRTIQLRNSHATAQPAPLAAI